MKHLSIEIRVYEHANHNALSHLTINAEGRLWGADFSAGQMGTFQSALIRLAIASFIIHDVDWQAEKVWAYARDAAIRAVDSFRMGRDPGVIT